MYLIGILILIFIVFFLISGKKENHSRKQGPAKPVFSSYEQGAVDFNIPIPKGFQVFADGIPVAGMQHRINEVIKFVRAKNQELNLEREPNNPHDTNAIKLIGLSGPNKFFIGYLPKELSAQIVATDTFESLKVRLRRIYIGTKDYIEINYQLLGPKTEKKRFDEFLNNQAADNSEKEYLKFFGLPISKGMTSGQAKEAINQHKKNSTNEQQEEWLGYSSILDEFDDTDFRETYEIKKVPKGILLEAMNQLKQEDKTYSYLADNIDEVVERIIKIRPDLERK